MLLTNNRQAVNNSSNRSAAVKYSEDMETHRLKSIAGRVRNLPQPEAQRLAGELQAIIARRERAEHRQRRSREERT